MQDSVSDDVVLAALHALEDLSATLGRDRKRRVEILRRHSDNPALSFILRSALDWRISFGLNVMAIPVSPLGGPSVSFAHWYAEFQKVILALTTRAATSAIAYKLVENFLNETATDPLARKWTIRTLAKELRIGISGKLAAEVYPDLGLDFATQKADLFDARVDIPTFPIAVEPKFSNLRVIFVIANRSVTAFSEEGRPFPILEEAFGSQLSRVCSDGCVEGGLYFEGWHPEVALSILNSKLKSITPGISLAKKIYFSMRIQALDYWDHRSVFSAAHEYTDPRALSQRRGILEKICFTVRQNNPKTSIKLFPLGIATTPDELATIATDFMTLRGCTGVILRDLEAPYTGTVRKYSATHSGKKEIKEAVEIQWS